MMHKKKLIEVALPLESINLASSKEKSIRHGHPSTLHLWWARRPLAAARAVIFSQMIDDPSEHPDEFQTQEAQDEERDRLFKLIEKLVLWENTNNDTVLAQARDEIVKNWERTCKGNPGNSLYNPEKLPGFHDPFAGGGALPLEGQRLGMSSFATDLNPVAVLINKSMIEIPSLFAGLPPINPKSRQLQSHTGSWVKSQGLAEDVDYYGKLLRKSAEQKLLDVYPKVKQGNSEYTVIAWIWARTVKSPNPAFAEIDVPLCSTFYLSSKVGKESYIEPIINGSDYEFVVRSGKPHDPDAVKAGTKLARGANFRCILSGSPITPQYIKSEGMAGRLGARLLAIVADGDKGRLYISANKEHESIAKSVKADWSPDAPLPDEPMSCWAKPYGLETFGDLFSNRQLYALTTITGLIHEVKEQAYKDALLALLPNTDVGLKDKKVSAKSYAEAIAVYLSLAVDKAADYWSSACSWHSSKELIRNTFGRQVIPMIWDYAEVNPLSTSTGNLSSGFDWAQKALVQFQSQYAGSAEQFDAQTQTVSLDKVVSTDPPYYNNIGYADLSDFFYVWLRPALKDVYPDLFKTLAAPKAEELVATPTRHGGKAKAEAFFLDGMTHAMNQIAKQAHPDFPVTIYYAFKQSESDGSDGTTNTGWDTFLAAVIEAGFSITGTWPMRTELSNRMIGSGNNALASSIVIVCRKTESKNLVVTRRDFINDLKKELPIALQHLQAGNIAPVDLAQAAIGPGMAVYTRYTSVIDADGQKVTVRNALSLINQTLDETLAEQEGEIDSDSRWALTWFDQNGFEDGDYGIAELLSKSKNVAVEGLVEAGIVASKAGKVRLLKPLELAEDWDPSLDKRISIWEVVHHLIKRLEKYGETGAAELFSELNQHAELARDLCYRLYSICERKKRTTEAISYNSLVQSWPEIARLASTSSSVTKQGTNDLFTQE